jgi:hypothetical protein
MYHTESSSYRFFFQIVGLEWNSDSSLFAIQLVRQDATASVRE